MLIIDRFQNLKNAALKESYIYFDQNIRKLPKNKDGTINEFAAGFDDNDVDAFRHAYVSGVFTQEYGDKVANWFGLLNEYSPEALYSNASDPRSRNMDLWNNKVGRKYGKKTSGRKTLLKLIHKALKRGELIIDLKDSREYTGPVAPPKTLSKPIVSTSKSETGRNQTFYDIQKKIEFTREELVSQIQAGEYPGYTVKVIRGVETPVSKRDGKITNNIG